LCIVGAGAAGITLALQFVQSRFRIIMLESGGEKLEAKQQALNLGASMDGVHPPASCTGQGVLAAQRYIGAVGACR
jgi:hypothetical protein